MNDIAKLIEQARDKYAVTHLKAPELRRIVDGLCDELERLTSTPLPSEVTELLLRHKGECTATYCWRCDAARLLESLARENARLAADNAELRGLDAAHEAKSLRQELTVAKAAHIRAVETAQQCYTELEVELKSHLRASQGEIDRLRAELETAKRGLTQLSQLGGGRSEGNLIAQETLAWLDAMKGGV